MAGGSITGNYAGNDGNGGGVFIDNNGTFNFSDGAISDNEGNRGGGGVGISNATFNMTGGTISGNMGGDITSSNRKGGGGVSIEENGVFNMSNGTILDNTSEALYIAYGGGVSVTYGSFTMTGGDITGNTVTCSNGNTYGGGVFIADVFSESGTFTKNGGSIDDTNSAQTGKVACVSNYSGYTVYIERNTTAGPSVNMNSRIAGSAGGCEE